MRNCFPGRSRLRNKPFPPNGIILNAKRRVWALFTWKTQKSCTNSKNWHCQGLLAFAFGVEKVNFITNIKTNKNFPALFATVTRYFFPLFSTLVFRELRFGYAAQASLATQLPSGHFAKEKNGPLKKSGQRGSQVEWGTRGWTSLAEQEHKLCPLEGRDWNRGDIKEAITFEVIDN